MSDTANSQLQAWTQLDEAALLRQLDTSAAGLNHAQAQERLLKVGPNGVAQGTSDTWPRLVLARLRNPLNVMLLVLSGISWGMGDVYAASVISAMVLLSVSLGVWQEHRSNQAAAALKAMVHTTASVLRPADNTLATVERSPRVD